MIVKDVSVGKQPICPGPDDVKVLGFIRIPGLRCDIEPSQTEQHEETGHCQATPPFVSAWKSAADRSIQPEL